VQDRVSAGASPALEEGLMLVEVNRLEASRQLLMSRVEIASLQLRALAGMAPDMPLTLRGELSDVIAPPEASEAVRRAFLARPDLAVARAEIATARARIRKERAEGRWDVSVNVGYQRQEMGFDLNGLTDRGGTRPIQDVFHFFGAGVSVMLPVRNRNEGNIAAAEAEARAAERRLEFAELTVRQEVGATLAQYDAARRSLEIYARGVREVAGRNLSVVRQSHELGRTSLLDVISEQRRYIEVENGYTETLKQVYDAAAESRRAIGAEPEAGR
jgi:cobalt-zinc-cadmium efflux system outer membrane protein